jgi:DNA polymerase I-like protein with 3'-5' exonuclease and polymerase domains
MDIIFGDRAVDIPWMHVMPKGMFHKQLLSLLDQLWSVIREEHDQYYMNQFLSNRELLMALQQPLVDVPHLRKVIEGAGLKRGEILKFLPEKGDVSPRSIYNQTGSITGRLTIESGPNILTLKREHRRILKSRFEGGKIIQIDISSLEPRIALAVAGKESPDDVYNFIGDKVLKGSLTRDQVKIAVLSCMYGASAWSLSKQIPKELDAKKILMEIKRYLKIPSLQRDLEKQIDKLGYIKNLCGRKIRSHESVVNHFLQSSGVDVSFNIFSQIIDDLQKNNINFVPIYVIHDALVLDIGGTDYKNILELTNIAYKADKLEGIFPVKVEIIKE